MRRDIATMIEAVPTENRTGDWQSYFDTFRSVVAHSILRVEHGAEPDAANDKVYGVPLGLVLKACLDIMDFSPTLNSITSWRELMLATEQVHSHLGVSPSAYADALDILGQEGAAVVIVCMLERLETINSPGGYLRVLTEKARAGAFSLGRLVMATMKIATTSSY